MSNVSGRTLPRTLTDWYLFALNGIKEKLLPVTRYIVADAYFSKKTFADGLLEQGFHLISRFRDAKQFTGLNHSQARSTAKMRFNFNASLTSVNIAKVMAKERGRPFSMASLKTMIHTEYLLQRFICVSGIKPNEI